jgi:HAD superfamily hydrolase (TIGR01549 family)
MMAVRAVFFDVGETLVDETRLWQAWADWLDVPHGAFFAVLGAAIERGENHRRVFERLSPGFDVERERAARRASGVPDEFNEEDLYPDALPCLRELRRRGYRIGPAGNQPSEAEELLGRMGLPVDVIASSAGWGVEKPSPEFFLRVASAAGAPPAQVAYVGDRLDNDVLPAAAAGMKAVFLHRGPWGYVQASRPEVARAHIRLRSLSGLPEALASMS